MKIIGLSGVAGAGKDLFYELLSTQTSCKKFSLADELKREITPYIKENFDIDPTSCSREEKNLIRPALVSHGTIKRKQTKGRYWIEKMQPLLKDFIFKSTLTNETPEYIVITDIRYHEYRNDEVTWLKNEMKGDLVHISNFTMTHGKRKFLAPANQEESRENPKLLAQADYLVEWEKLTGEETQVKNILIRDVIKDFLKWQKKI